MVLSHYEKFLKTYRKAFKKLIESKFLNIDVSEASFSVLYGILELEKNKDDAVLAIPDEDKKEASIYNYNLSKLAHSKLSRWLKNKLLKLNPLSSTASIRVNIYESAEVFNKTLNELLNMLEKDIDKDKFKALVNSLNEEFAKFSELFDTLSQMVMSQELGDPETADMLQKLIKKKKLKQLSMDKA